MGNRCRFLGYVDGLAICKVYDKRLSPNCRQFPMSERDLAERDVILPENPCGWTFAKEPAADSDTNRCPGAVARETES